MQAVLPFKKRARLFAGASFNIARKFFPLPKGGVRVLVYHSVTDGPPSSDLKENTIYRQLFEAQIRALSELKFNVIGAEEAVKAIASKKSLPERAVVITFDDGYKDILRNALPALTKYGFPYTLFVTTGFLGQEGHLSRNELKSISLSSLATIGCHGRTHRMLSSLSDKELQGEISGVRHDVEDITGKRALLYAYPFGHQASYDKCSVRKLKEEGFLGAFNNIFGYNLPGQDTFTIRRNRISWADAIPAFEAHLNGAYDWFSLFVPLKMY